MGSDPCSGRHGRAVRGRARRDRRDRRGRAAHGQDRAARAVAYLASRQKANGAIVALLPDRLDGRRGLLVRRGGRGSCAHEPRARVPADSGRGGERRHDRPAGQGRAGGECGGSEPARLRRREPDPFAARHRLRRPFRRQRRVRRRQRRARPRGGGHHAGDGHAAWLLAAQCPDGGWAYDLPYGPGDDDHCFDGTGTDFFTSDSNATSLMVQALAGMHTTDWFSGPFGYFDTFTTGRREAGPARHRSWPPMRTPPGSCFRSGRRPADPRGRTDRAAETTVPEVRGVRLHLQRRREG